MGLKNLRQITAALIAGGRAPETPAAVISQGTTPRQRTVTGTLATIAALVEQTQLPTPAVTVIGEVVNLREKLAWFERRNSKSLI
jgi:siroheme synthase